MSLLVWLPMTKDLIQQGLSDLTVTNNGATLNDNGKLGKCYYFDGNAHYLEFSKSLSDLYSGDFSYAVWLKPTDDTRSIICSEYSASGASNVAFELSAARGIRLYWNGSPDIYPSNCTLPKNEWSHVVITRSGNVAMFYINGVLKYTYTGTLANKTSTAKIRLGDDYRGGTSVSYMGYMNDFRIYDHALSAKEVEILSRGLVCHYPLNGNGRGGDNLLIYSNATETNFTALKNRGSGTWNKLSLTTKDGYDCYLYDKSLSSTAFSTGAWYSPMKANTTYTYSAWIYFTASANFNFTSLGHFQVYNSNSTASDKSHEDIANARIYEPSTIPANKWTKIRITFTTNNLANSYFQVYPRYNIGANVGDLYFRDMKLEEGDHVTPWMPNSADTTYTAMGYDSTTEYDVSGNGYNGTKTGTFVYDADTPRYSVCTKYSGSNYSYVTSPSSEIRTIAFWAKWDTIPSGQSILFVDGKSKTGFGLASNGIICSSNSVQTYTFNKSNLVANVWYHFVVVCPNGGSNTARKLYINGVEQTATSNQNYWVYSLDQLQIGKRSSSSDGFVGKMSDFRAYATALSAAQVADLYNTAVSVANNGTLMGYELVES